MVRGGAGRAGQPALADEGILQGRTTEDVVQAQAAARIIALDLSAVQAIGGGGLGMLAFLDRWARDHDIQLKLFSPSRSVVDGLVHSRLMPNLEIATLHEMMDILAESDSRYRIAA